MELNIEQIKQVLILGCGTLGSRIGLQAAISGYEVVMYDVAEKAFEPAMATHGSILQMLVRKEQLTEAAAEAVKGRISWTTDAAAAAANADLVSESVPEDVPLKKKVWAQFGSLCPEHTLFTTNTSYLLPSMFAEDSGRPEMFCALHFHDVFLARVVDIMPHPGTAPWVTKLLDTFGRKLNQIPVYIDKETPGYLFNAMLGSIFMTAMKLAAAGKAKPEEVDRSWMGNFNMPIGPFGMMDSIGLDTVWHVTKNDNSPLSKSLLSYVEQYVNAGKLGVKSGEGFYTYPDAAYKAKDFLG